MEFSHMLSNSNHIFNWYTYFAIIGTYDIAHSDEMLHRKNRYIFCGQKHSKKQIKWNNAEKVNYKKQKQDMLATPH